MSALAIVRIAALLPLAALLLATPGTAQVGGIKPGTTTTTTFVPKFEAVAETRLLMEGMANPNYQSVNRLIKNKPTVVATWAFARGQAILMAETGNRLLLRPPRNSGRDSWMKLAMEMRSQAVTLARHLGAQDFAKSKAALNSLTTSCNRCHQTFRVPVRVAPEPDASERNTE